MPTASLPAASLRAQLRLPARRVRLRAANDLIRLALCAIGGAILRAQSNFLPALREDERSADREVPGDDAVLEDAAAAVGEVALLGEAIERAADRFGSVSGCGRHVLRQVVAEAATGREERFETAGEGDQGERLGHRPDLR